MLHQLMILINLIFFKIKHYDLIILSILYSLNYYIIALNKYFWMLFIIIIHLEQRRKSKCLYSRSSTKYSTLALKKKSKVLLSILIRFLKTISKLKIFLLSFNIIITVYRAEISNVNLKSGINSGQNLDKGLKKLLKVSFELPEL